MAAHAARLAGFRYLAAQDDAAGGATARSLPSFRGGDGASAEEEFTSDESAARFYLDRLLGSDERPALRSVTAPEDPALMPGLTLEDARDLRQTGTRLVRFRQRHRDIPVFGARAVVELDGERRLVSAECRVDEVSGVNPHESLSSLDALQRVAEVTGTELGPDDVVGPRLNFFKARSDEGGERWHLVWLLPEVPAAPSAEGATGGHFLGPRPTPRFTYLVDAHDGEVVYWFSRTPSADSLPVKCRGIDEDGSPRTFRGRFRDDSWGYELADPLGRLATYDLGLADVATSPPLPQVAVTCPSVDFADGARAAVSAHVHAGLVQDYYRSVLKRNGIDDQGMTLVSLVNCCYSPQQPPPELLNAFWYDHKMWYGQVSDGTRLVSLSRFLDVIGHELTHGVVEFTSGLVYRDEPGALNESFADVFGVLISNAHHAADPQDPATWSWEIGPGLGRGGAPLRDFADPAACGQPAHYDDRYTGSQDEGGVHINSGIPNKAVHLLLTAQDASGARVFSVEDVAVLMYLGLQRLDELAEMSDLRSTLLAVAAVLFAGDEGTAGRLAAIEEAYTAVGVS